MLRPLWLTAFIAVNWWSIGEVSLQPESLSPVFQNHRTKEWTNLDNITFSFDCTKRSVGFYADMEYNCQIFHMCDEEGNRIPHLCANETSFNQEYRICDWDYNFNCTDSPKWFYLNELTYATESPEEYEEDIDDDGSVLETANESVQERGTVDNTNHRPHSDEIEEDNTEEEDEHVNIGEHEQDNKAQRQSIGSRNNHHQEHLLNTHRDSDHVRVEHLEQIIHPINEQRHRTDHQMSDQFIRKHSQRDY